MMGNKKKRFIIFLLVFIVGTLAGIVGYLNAKITTFEECEKAGWLVRSIRIYDGNGPIENEDVRDISGEKVSLKDFLRRVEEAIPPQDAVTQVRTQAAQASPRTPGFGVLMVITGLLVVTMLRREK